MALLHTLTHPSQTWTRTNAMGTAASNSPATATYGNLGLQWRWHSSVTMLTKLELAKSLLLYSFEEDKKIYMQLHGPNGLSSTVLQKQDIHLSVAFFSCSTETSTT